MKHNRFYERARTGCGADRFNIASLEDFSVTEHLRDANRPPPHRFPIVGVRELGHELDGLFGSGPTSVLAPFTVGKMMLNLGGTVNYSQISARHLPWALNRA